MRLPRPAPTVGAEDEDDLLTLRHAIMRLPLEYREPLVLQVLGGFSTEEIARELSLSSTAVLTRLFRARNKLRVLCGMAAAADVSRRQRGGAMNCAHARLLLGAEPHSAAAELAAHLASCSACATFRDEMRALDARIARALERPPDLAPARRPPRSAPRGGSGRWRPACCSPACSLIGVWLLRPSDTLARDLVAHVQHEPDSWFATQQVSAQGIGDALHRSGVAIDLTSDRVTYAQSCWFRGHYVPHLVVQTAQGPATVLLLRHEQVPGPRTFREGGMNGIIVPADRGSVAVLAHGANVQLLAQQMQQDVRWLPEPR